MPQCEDRARSAIAEAALSFENSANRNTREFLEQMVNKALGLGIDDDPAKIDTQYLGQAKRQVQKEKSIIQSQINQHQGDFLEETSVSELQEHLRKILNVEAALEEWVEAIESSRAEQSALAEECTKTKTQQEAEPVVEEAKKTVEAKKSPEAEDYSTADKIKSSLEDTFANKSPEEIKKALQNITQFTVITLHTGLRLRNSEHFVVGMADKGSRVKYEGDVKWRGDRLWIKTSVNGKEGWMAGKYLNANLTSNTCPSGQMSGQTEQQTALNTTVKTTPKFATPPPANGQQFINLKKPHNPTENQFHNPSQQVTDAEIFSAEKLMPSQNEITMALNNFQGNEQLLTNKVRDINGLDLWIRQTTLLAQDRKNEWALQNLFESEETEKADEVLIFNAENYGEIAQQLRIMLLTDSTVSSFDMALSKMGKTSPALSSKLSAFKQVYEGFWKGAPHIMGKDPSTLIFKDLEGPNGINGAKLRVANRLHEEGLYDQAADLYKEIFLQNEELVKKIKERSPDVKEINEDLPDPTDIENQFRDSPTIMNQLQEELRTNSQIVVTQVGPDGNPTGNQAFNSIDTALANMATNERAQAKARIVAKAKIAMEIDEVDPKNLSNLSKSQKTALQKYQEIYGLEEGWDLSDKTEDMLTKELLINGALLIVPGGVAFLAGRLAVRGAFAGGNYLACRSVVGLSRFAKYANHTSKTAQITRGTTRLAIESVVAGQTMHQIQHMAISGNIDDPTSREALNSMAIWATMGGLGRVNPWIQGKVANTGWKEFKSPLKVLGKAYVKGGVLTQSAVSAATLTKIDSLLSGDEAEINDYLRTYATFLVLHGVSKGMTKIQADKYAIDGVKVLYNKVKATRLNLDRFKSRDVSGQTSITMNRRAESLKMNPSQTLEVTGTSSQKLTLETTGAGMPLTVKYQNGSRTTSEAVAPGKQTTIDVNGTKFRVIFKKNGEPKVIENPRMPSLRKRNPIDMASEHPLITPKGIYFKKIKNGKQVFENMSVNQTYTFWKTPTTPGPPISIGAKFQTGTKQGDPVTVTVNGTATPLPIGKSEVFIIDGVKTRISHLAPGKIQVHKNVHPLKVPDRLKKTILGKHRLSVDSTNTISTPAIAVGEKASLKIKDLEGKTITFKGESISIGGDMTVTINGNSLSPQILGRKAKEFITPGGETYSIKLSGAKVRGAGTPHRLIFERTA